MTTNTNDTVASFLVRPETLTPEACEALVRKAADMPATDGAIVRDADSATRRSSTVRWLAADSPTAQALYRVVEQLNDRFFRFDIEGFESLQIARYGVGDRYDEHLDLGPGPTSRRKISVTVQLSAPDAYTGGDLGLRGVVPPKSRLQGSAVVFPSYLPHAVAPVTSGVRWSVVGWVVGPPFR